ncbi:hypothetical protein Syun_031812 [Stephania yunnanensis]|uniref:Uncharacterized protein n=1 Tax=Stephania yunnanensis TaxID=152371 RepID=A0AAP0HEH8_9MAGN
MGENQRIKSNEWISCKLDSSIGDLDNDVRLQPRIEAIATSFLDHWKKVRKLTKSSSFNNKVFVNKNNAPEPPARCVADHRSSSSIGFASGLIGHLPHLPRSMARHSWFAWA